MKPAAVGTMPGVDVRQGAAARGTGTVLAGRYELGPLLGSGGMADVYRAVDQVLGRPVAAKVFRPAAVTEGDQARFTAEARLLAGLSHPGLVTVHDAGVSAGPGVPDAGSAGRRPAGPAAPGAFLILELVDGPTLADCIRQGSLTPQQVAGVGVQLAAALGYVHGRGIVHRDVKPGNVLLRYRAGRPGAPEAKLADFGIARLVDAAAVTAPGTTLGTASYLSPEQVTGDPAGPAADVYALGLLLLECLTGERAYPGSTVETALARLHRAPQIPAGVGAGWQDLLTAMTARDPAGRPAAGDLSGRLAALADGAPRSDRAPLTEPVGLAAGSPTAGRAAPAAGSATGRDGLPPTAVLPVPGGPDLPGATRASRDPATAVDPRPAASRPPAGPEGRPVRWIRGVLVGGLALVALSILLTMLVGLLRPSQPAGRPAGPSAPPATGSPGPARLDHDLSVLQKAVQR